MAAGARRGPSRSPVTIARSVAPGREGEFEDWSAALTRAASRWPGFLGAGLLRPGHVGEPWHVVFRFASAADLAAWETSPERAEILAAGEPLVARHDCTASRASRRGSRCPAAPRPRRRAGRCSWSPRPRIYLLNILLTTLYGGFIAGLAAGGAGGARLRARSPRS